MSRLLSEIEMGAVALAVGDLDRSLDYYRRTIGLELLQRDNGRAVLGVPGRPLLELETRPGGRRDPDAADLFHFALLVPSRAALGRQLRHFVETDARLTGASEHFVSEALYLRDPDGHGIEVYRDRPREDRSERPRGKPGGRKPFARRPPRRDRSSGPRPSRPKE